MTSGELITSMPLKLPNNSLNVPCNDYVINKENTDQSSSSPHHHQLLNNPQNFFNLQHNLFGQQTAGYNLSISLSSSPFLTPDDSADNIPYTRCK